MDPSWVTAVVAFATAVLGVLIWISRLLWKMFGKTSQFLDDWNGKDSDKGHAAIKGVMERLVNLESGVTAIKEVVDENVSRLTTQDRALETIRAEVTLNTGHSMKDTVEEIYRIVMPEEDQKARKRIRE